jgi:MFS family permease
MIPPRIQRLALVNVCLGQFMSAVDSRSVNVALPTLSGHFSASMAVVQWIPLAYQLTIVGLVLSMARLGDMVGRKQIYTLGFVLLGFGSAGCGFSAALWQIILFRVIEAVGGALVLANGRTIASALYAQEGEGGRARHDVDVVSSRIYRRSLRGWLSRRHCGLALDLFYEFAGSSGGGLRAWKILLKRTEKRDYSIDPIGMITLMTVVALIIGLQETARSGSTARGVAASALSWDCCCISSGGAMPLELRYSRCVCSRRNSHSFLLPFPCIDFFAAFYPQGICTIRPPGRARSFFSLVIVWLAPSADGSATGWAQGCFATPVRR